MILTNQCLNCREITLASGGLISCPACGCFDLRTCQEIEDDEAGDEIRLDLYTPERIGALLAAVAAAE